MADQHIRSDYSIEGKTGDIHRKRVNGAEVIEDKIVAKYDAEKQIVTFPNKWSLRNYKTGVTTFLAENEMIVKSFQLGDMPADKPLTDKSVPPRPKKDPLQGDKTPAVVEWYMRYRWNEFCARYGYLGKFTGRVRFLEPQWRERPGDKQPEFVGQAWIEKDVVDAIVATRKTHLTFTPDECKGWDEEDPEMEAGDQGDERVATRSSEED